MRMLLKRAPIHSAAPDRSKSKCFLLDHYAVSVPFSSRSLMTLASMIAQTKPILLGDLKQPDLIVRYFPRHQLAVTVFKRKRIHPLTASNIPAYGPEPDWIDPCNSTSIRSHNGSSKSQWAQHQQHIPVVNCRQR